MSGRDGYNRLRQQAGDDVDDDILGRKQKKGSWTLYILIGLVVVLLVATIIFAGLFGYAKATEKHSSTSNFPLINLTGPVNFSSPLFNLTDAIRNSSSSSICTTWQCVQAAYRMRSYMDTTSDHCTDFYNYSCGGWMKNNPIPEGEEIWGTFEQLSKDNYQHMIGYAEQPITGKDLDAIRKMKLVFAACMDAATIQNKSMEAIVGFLDLTGGWDDAGINQTEPWQLNTSLALEHFYSSDSFFGFDIEPDEDNSSMYSIGIAQSGLTYPIPEAYSNASFVDDLADYIGGKLDMIGIEEPFTMAVAIAQFEAAMAGIFLSNTDLRNETLTYNPMTIGNFSEIFPEVDWVEYFNMIFNKSLGDKNMIQFTEDSEVVIETLQYFYNLSELINSTMNSSPETLQSYAKWHVVLQVLNYIDASGANEIEKLMHKVRFPKTSRLISSNDEDARAFSCIEVVEQTMQFALARPFVDEFITEDLIKQVNSTVNAIEEAFKNRIMEKDWLDKTTKDRCVDKVNAITRQIAYPSFVKNDKELDAYYEALEIEKDFDYFAIGLNSQQFQLAMMLAQYGKPVDKTQWLNAPTEVNAYYDPSFNQFVFLAGILRPPFIQLGWVDSLLFGGIGMVVGHELTHGFDDQGQQYDENGDRKTWWTPGSTANFTKRTQCFVNQYDHYSLDGFPINGKLTLGENIADNGGIHTAYDALVNLKSNDTLPGLPYSKEQLYFISFGQLWCSAFTADALAQSTKSDPHSPGPIRVIGAIQNSYEFSVAFNCSKPEKPCELW